MSLIKISLDQGLFETTHRQKRIHDSRTQGTVLGQSEGETQASLLNHGIDPDEAITDAELFGRETFARVYNDPKQIENPDCPEWLKYASNVLSDPEGALEEFNLLRDACSGDVDFSTLAASSLIDMVNEILPQYFKNIESDEDQNEGEHLSGAEFNIKEWTENGLRQRVKVAVAENLKDIQETKAILASIFPGSEVAPPATDDDCTARYELIQKIRNSKELSKILDLAGAIKRIHRYASKKKIPHGASEIHGLTRGNDISRLLPMEVCKFAHPVLFKQAYSDFSERKMLQYELIAKDRVGRGDMVVLIDESYSMSDPAMGGTRHDWARALVIAAISIAKKDKRNLTIIGFNADIRYIAEFPRHGALWNGESENPLRATMKIMEMDCDGGTKFDPVLVKGLEFCKSNRADLIFITDGDANVSEETVKTIKSKKELGVYGIQIGSSASVKPSLSAVCTKVLNLDTSESISDTLASIFS